MGLIFHKPLVMMTMMMINNAYKKTTAHLKTFRSARSKCILVTFFIRHGNSLPESLVLYRIVASPSLKVYSGQKNELAKTIFAV